jgi:GH18 family chitinase
MTYDYHGVWDDVTGLNSPLYARESSESSARNSRNSGDNWKNANYSINYWISNGCPPEKINFGLAAYGRSFTLKNSTINKVGAPAIKGGQAGSFTKEEGIYSYFEICEKLNVENWKKYWDDKQQSVYATYDDQWVGFDNQRSIALKVKWASSMSLGGTMLWTLDFDDYTGQFCNQGPFPLANAIRDVFEQLSPQSYSNSSTNLTVNDTLSLDNDTIKISLLELNKNTTVTSSSVLITKNLTLNNDNNTSNSILDSNKNFIVDYKVDSSNSIKLSNNNVSLANYSISSQSQTPNINDTNFKNSAFGCIFHYSNIIKYYQLFFLLVLINNKIK